jgi:ubiquinone/menaquinone biosynthesis C-methylase UbiE
MFTNSAELYDVVYSWKDYAKESQQIEEMIAAHSRSDGNSLLDVACGTGKHLKYLRDQFDVEGLDLDESLLAIARKRLPDIPLHLGDMCDFNLGKQFDVVTCLFSAIGYVGSVERMNLAVRTMARHLKPGGVLLFEAWLSPDIYEAGSVRSLTVEDAERKIVRMVHSALEGRMSVMNFHYLVGMSEGIQHVTELHRLFLFTEAEYLAACEAAGLIAIVDAQGISGRGLYIGAKSL